MVRSCEGRKLHRLILSGFVPADATIWPASAVWPSIAVAAEATGTAIVEDLSAWVQALCSAYAPDIYSFARNLALHCDHIMLHYDREANIRSAGYRDSAFGGRRLNRSRLPRRGWQLVACSNRSADLGVVGPVTGGPSAARSTLDSSCLLTPVNFVNAEAVGSDRACGAACGGWTPGRGHSAWISRYLSGEVPEAMLRFTGWLFMRPFLYAPPSVWFICVRQGFGRTVSCLLIGEACALPPCEHVGHC